MLRTRDAAARLLGIHTKTLHLWESKGIIPLPQRDSANRRLYTMEDVEMLKLVVTARRNRAAKAPR